MLNLHIETTIDKGLCSTKQFKMLLLSFARLLLTPRGAALQ